MRFGMGIDLSLTERSVSLGSFNFASASRTMGAFVLPSWLSITCASTGRTAQTSASTVRSGFGANAARARSVDGSTWGLLVESVRANESDADPSTWTAFNGGEITVTSATDPTGNSSTCSFNTLTTTTPFVGKAMTIGSGTRCVSAWARNALASAGTINSNIADIANAGAIALPGSDATFVRRDVAGTTAGGSKFSVIQPRTGAVAGSVLVYGYQIEAGLYPGSVLGAGVSRAADVLSMANPSRFAPGGFLDWTVSFAPHYSSSEQGSDHDLVFFNSTNRLFLQASTHKLVLRIGGADVLSSALTWSRNQAIIVRLVHRQSGRSLTVTGASSGNGTTQASGVSAITMPGTAYLIGNASGAQESTDLRNLSFAN